jgi:reprolysin-like metallo-peptidase family M12B
MKRFRTPFFLTLLVVLFFACHSFGQKTFFAKEIILSSDVQKEVESKMDIKSYKTFLLDLKNLNLYLKSSANSHKIGLIFTLGKNKWNLNLEENPFQKSNVSLRSIPKVCNTYRGFVDDLKTNPIRLYISSNYIGGYVTIDNKRFHLAPLKSILNSAEYTGQFILYESPYIQPVNNTRTTTCEEIWVEIGMHGSYAFYLAKGGDNNPNAKEEVIEIIEDITNQAAGFYSEQLDLFFNIVIRGTEDGDPIVWTTPEPWPCCLIATKLFNQLNAEWMLNRPCLPKDAIFLFAKENYPGGGQATGQVCNNPPDQVDIAFIDRVQFSTPGQAFKFAHELGHLFGAKEAEDTPCSSICSTLPPQGTPVMCTFGYGTQDLSVSFLDDCSKDEIIATINGACGECLGEPDPIPACLTCYQSAWVTVDNRTPVADCSGKDILNYTRLVFLQLIDNQ